MAAKPEFKTIYKVHVGWNDEKPRLCKAVVTLGAKRISIIKAQIDDDDRAAWSYKTHLNVNPNAHSWTPEDAWDAYEARAREDLAKAMDKLEDALAARKAWEAERDGKA